MVWTQSIIPLQLASGFGLALWVGAASLCCSQMQSWQLVDNEAQYSLRWGIRHLLDASLLWILSLSLLLCIGGPWEVVQRNHFDWNLIHSKFSFRKVSIAFAILASSFCIRIQFRSQLLFQEKGIVIWFQKTVRCHSKNYEFIQKTYHSFSEL